MSWASTAPGLGHLHRVVPEVGGAQVPQEQAAVGVGVGAHAAVPLGGQGLELGDQSAVLIEQLLGAVAAQPLLQLLDAAGGAVGTAMGT